MFAYTNKSSIQQLTRIFTRNSTYKVEAYLIKDVPNLGPAGKIVVVKPGYARNKLIPEGKAILVGHGPFRKKLPVLHQAEFSQVKQITPTMVRTEIERLLSVNPPALTMELMQKRIKAEEKEAAAVSAAQQAEQVAAESDAVEVVKQQ